MYKVKKINETIRAQAQKRWRSIAKPLGSLGVFEDIITQIASVQGTLNIDISKRCALVMCADNGVVEEGVTQTKSYVTAIVAENISKGLSTVSIAAKTLGADCVAVDVGMARDTSGTLNKKIAYSTKNFAYGSAMMPTQAEKAVQIGIDLVNEYSKQGYKLVIAGEMGIGNTTTGSAISAVLLGKSAAQVTGCGAGLSDEGLRKKIAVIDSAISRLKPDKNDILDVISKVGGFDIAAMTGIFIGAAMCGVCAVIDGFISSVAALCASKLCPDCVDFMIASHVSNEACSAQILELLGKTTPIHAGMFPGEGAGGVMLLPLLDAAAAVFKEMPTFEQTGVGQYEEMT